MKLPLPAFEGGAEPFGRSDVLLIQSLSAREAAWRRLFDKSDNLSTLGQDAGRLVCAKLTHRRLPGHPRSCVDLLKFLRSLRANLPASNSLTGCGATRLDKYLKVSRLAKRRAEAKDGIEAGRITRDGRTLKPGYEATPEVENKVKAAIETDIGKIARPKNIWIVPDMPKTRSGKIMRRVIAATSNFSDVGDITTLANPEVVEQIRHQVQNAKHARGEVPRELTEAEEAEITSFGADS